MSSKGVVIIYDNLLRATLERTEKILLQLFSLSIYYIRNG